MKSETTFHQQLQNRILFICNMSIFILMILLAIVSFSSKQSLTGIVAIIGCTILGVSLFLQFLGYFVVSSYITVLALSFTAFGAVFARSVITPDLLYLFVSYQVIPLVLSGILAQNRIFPISLTTIVLLFLSYFIISIQGPAIGYAHTVQIAGSYVCIIVIAILSDQTYLLSGKMMNRFNEEIQLSNAKDKNINSFIKVYQNNKASGNQLEQIAVDNDTQVGKLNEFFQKFTENMHVLRQLLKDITIRNDNVTGSGANILEVFINHKDNITSYKNKIEHISETSQEIDHIIQNKKIQMHELIELSTKGGLYMQDSVSAIEKVSENTKSMVDMISLIMEVAEKTNILALNAAVEASRAGKYGGGFAIVAKEIKALSTETTQNADTINRSLQNNIATISEAVTTIKSVGNSFVILNDSIMEFSTAIDQIVIKINDLAQQNTHMSIETKNTLSLITEVQNVIEKTIHTMEQGQQKISNIQQISTDLDKDISQIHQTTTTLGDSGRKIQEKYREFCFSVKNIESVIDNINSTTSTNIK